MSSRSSRRRGGVEPLLDPEFVEALSPRRPERSFHNARADQKTKQLCRQVQRALGLALGGECADPVLGDVYVLDVMPAPDSSRLLVLVSAPSGGHAPPAVEVLAHLDRAAGLLRRCIAEAITRKKVPELAFAVAGAGEVMP